MNWPRTPKIVDHIRRLFAFVVCVCVGGGILGHRQASPCSLAEILVVHLVRTEYWS